MDLIGDRVSEVDRIHIVGDRDREGVITAPVDAGACAGCELYGAASNQVGRVGIGVQLTYSARAVFQANGGEVWPAQGVVL